MDRSTCDIAIVGGGLAGGLIALALRQRRPDQDVRLFEAGETLGGNHRWSWFASDLDQQAQHLLAPFHTTQWTAGYEVRFPTRHRVLPTPYHSLDSADFAAGLQRELGQNTIHTSCAVTGLAADGVQLADGRSIGARVVIDCRDRASVGDFTGGWQVFMGRHLRLPAPHGVERPTIMDAAVEQLGGYRFVYVLPLGPREIFIEDTYYQDTPVLDTAALSARIDAYAAQHGWHGETIGSETGVLPVITGGDFAAFQAANRIQGVGMAGARGGFVHPLTSYTVPFAVETALAIAGAADLPGEQMAAMLEARAQRHWQATGFYRMLGTMLFGAAEPEARWRVFARFYGLSAGLIERFYAARSTLTDRARILCGRPPVSIVRAVRAIASPKPPLKDAA